MRISIVGVGLQGGSFGMAVRTAGAAEYVAGIDLDRATLDRACERGAIDKGFLDLNAGIDGANLVVLATPVRSILDLLPKVVPLLGQETILFDLGSTKEAIVSAIAELANSTRYVGGHLMAGVEHAGIEHADPCLLRNATFALVPPRVADEKAVSQLTDLVRQIGANPVVIPADRHDRIVSITSHLPYLFSVVLSLAAEKMAQKENQTRVFTASGFRDTTRLAGSNVRVMADICLTNRQPILHGIDEAKQLLDELAKQIEQGDELGLVKTLTEAKESRTALFGTKGEPIEEA